MALMRELIRGGIAGGAATWVMDLITTGVLEKQAPEVTEREQQAWPNGKPAIENAVDALEAKASIRLDERQRSLVTQCIHYGLGALPGAAYAVLRRRVPLLGAAGGMLFGVALWAVNDEFLNTKLGFAGPFDAYPMETHLRGLIGHTALGAATDTFIDALGG
jgi:hypothetical protein